ncbi:MAG TPA: outer membrane lipoprotein-sorting protein [Spirochaetota bacterium]|nr:outer membrane lipoprotein-sorting protein [Spirochaetota bacterium]HPI89234.1 outer membrane lipoprotein-sorting protein [Spirochaetota bacterium]HPR48949.1 outer membrane lipoprotein-sorting protein [Spirochaetota bacterium]
MKRLKSLMTMFILGIAVVAFSETDVDKGTRLSVMNDQQPKFQKMKGETILHIYGSDGKLKAKKEMIVAQYIENMGSDSEVENSISYMKEPADERGNAYMAYNYKTKPDAKFVYMRGIRKAKKVAGASKKTPFFGSDFYVNDMGYPDISECNYKYLGQEKIKFKGKDFDCMVIEALPKNDTIKSETGYGRKVGYLVQVNDKSFLTLKLDYYDENLKKLKELTLISFLTGKNVKGETVFFTTSIELKNVQRGTKTILELKNLKFEADADVRSDIFTEQYLTQKWW